MSWTSGFGRACGVLLDAIVRLLALSRINPNVLTLMGLVVNTYAAFLFGYANGDNQRRMFFYAGLVIFGAGIFDMVDGRVARRNLNRERIMQQPLRQAANVVRVGGGEQQVLALLRQQSNDLANVVDKAHVEHAIRFIEDEHLNFRQIDRALLREIE